MRGVRVKRYGSELDALHGCGEALERSASDSAIIVSARGHYYRHGNNARFRASKLNFNA